MPNDDQQSEAPANPNETISEEPANSIETIGELREHLFATHALSVGLDDPILLEFTIQRVFMDNYERMLARHNSAITKIISGSLKGLSEPAIKATLNELETFTKSSHLEFEKQYKRQKFLTVLNWIPAAICILVFIYFVTK